ncbi:MAG: hypothetical protein IJF23_01770 [Clostridia bacterium]|nr:hypothetical protein [Clostridia bacterium]
MNIPVRKGDTNDTISQTEDHRMHGCQKRMYCMKNLRGVYFEEVYFILKKNAPDASSPIASMDLAGEAERIVREAAETLPCRKSAHPPVFGRAAAFALGAASSSAVIGTVALILSTL